MRRNWLAVVFVMLIGTLAMFGLTACTQATTGHVSGEVYARGGAQGPQWSTPSPQPLETEVIATPIDGDAGQTWSTFTDPKGSFVLDLLPGTYEITALLSAQNPKGDRATEKVTVAAGGDIQISLHFDAP